MMNMVKILIIILASLLIEVTEGNARDCNFRAVEDGWYCVCDLNGCDDIRVPWPRQTGESILVRSSKAGERLKVFNLASHQEEVNNSRGTPVVQLRIDTRRRHQRVLGYGGAFTDSAGYNIMSLPRPLSIRLIEDYYGKCGLQYNLGRVPIGCTDFSLRTYSYDDTEKPDYQLRQWRLAPEDFNYKLPLLHQAKYLTESQGRQLKLIATPWTPPKWMKANHDFHRGSIIDDSRIYTSYANYLVKFFDAYKRFGINFWGATIQNEPVTNAGVPGKLVGVQFEPAQMGKFIANYYGPALEAHNYTSTNMKLLVGDDLPDNNGKILKYIFEHPEIAKYISGYTFHYYTLLKSYPYHIVKEDRQLVGDKAKYVLMSEASEGANPDEMGTRLGSWHRGENYAFSIINDLNRKTQAWIDWNMTGGPNVNDNRVDSPILIDQQQAAYYKQPMYYALAHFTRFLGVGTTIVDGKLLGTPNDGKLAVLVGLDERSNYLVANVLNRYQSDRIINIADGSFLDGLTSLPGASLFVARASSISTLVIKL